MSEQEDTSTPLRVRSRGQRMKAGARRTAKRLFLQSYALQGITSYPPRANLACKTAHVSRATLYHWLKTDPRFKATYRALQAVYFQSWYFCPGALHDPEFEPERTQHLKHKRGGQRLIRSYQKRQTQRKTTRQTDT